MTNSNSMRLRAGVRDPVFLLISLEAVQQQDVERVYQKSLRFIMADKSSVLLYRQAVTMVFEGWDDDPRELVDIPEVRSFVHLLAKRWPEWAYYLSQIDTSSVALMLSVLAGVGFPGQGRVEMDKVLLEREVRRAFDGMNSVYDRYLDDGLSDKQCEEQSLGFVEVINQRT